VLTGSLTGDDEIGEHHKRHGDGVRSIALSVPDATAAYEHAVAHGARGIQTPHQISDEDGTAVLASVQTYGETHHVSWSAGTTTAPSSRLRRAREGSDRSRTGSWSGSTTSSATSGSGTWRSGSTTTSACSA